MYIASFSVILHLLLWQQAASLHPLSDEFIDHINKQGKWKAGRNFHSETPITYIRGLLGAKPNALDLNVQKIQHDPEFVTSLPESFDPRDKWPNCSSLHEIRDQGQCGSCWAFGAVGAMTDRVCTYSNGKDNFHFSAQDLLSCSNAGGCHGGNPSNAWKSWVNEGIVSGGNYDSEEGCIPYQIPPCNNHPVNCTNYIPTPTCIPQCRSGYSRDYRKDKRRGARYYNLSGEDDFKAELFKNGPFEVTFTVYEDFLNYKSGVYEHVSGEELNGHAVKMIGWGEEGGKKYWLVANSWNTGWGDEGFFKIRRGVDECYIEDGGVAGDPQ